MARQRRPENKGLPARWRFTHGAYYYQVPQGLEYLWDNKKTFPLGKALPDAYKVWAQRIGSVDKANNIGQLLERYAIQVVPTKAPKTRIENIRQIGRLRAVFGEMLLMEIEPQHIYKYVDKRSAKVSAHREIAVLSHACTKAVEWGFISHHPFKGEVRLAGEKPRTRYVEDWEIIECLSLPSVQKRGSVLAIQSYIRLKLITGLRRGDMLRLRLGNCGEDGLRVTTSKTGKTVVYEWTEDLRGCIEGAKSSRPVDISPLLFCTRHGKPYINEDTGDASGWNSMWQRFMDRVLKETKVSERFTEHDLRAKCASDAKTLEHARALLSHADSKITERVYRRKPERIRPAR